MNLRTNSQRELQELLLSRTSEESAQLFFDALQRAYKDGFNVGMAKAAAEPDLLAACELLVKHYKTANSEERLGEAITEHVIDAVYAAIAKAEGKP